MKKKKKLFQKVAKAVKVNPKKKKAKVIVNLQIVKMIVTVKVNHQKVVEKKIAKAKVKVVVVVAKTVKTNSVVKIVILKIVKNKNMKSSMKISLKHLFSMKMNHEKNKKK